MDNAVQDTLLQLVKDAGRPLRFTEIVMLYGEQALSLAGRAEIAMALQNLRDSGQLKGVWNNQLSDLLYSYSGNEEESEQEHEESSEQERGMSPAQKLKQIKAEMADVTEPEDWADLVLEALPFIEKRKENKDLLDYPVRDMMRDGKAEEITDLMDEDKELMTVFFTKCSYWPTLRDLLDYMIEHRPDLFDKGLKLYEENSTALAREHSVEYVKDRLLRHEYFSYRTKLSDMLENHEHGENFVREFWSYEAVVSLDEAVDRLIIFLCNLEDTEDLNEFLPVYNSICSKLAGKYGAKVLCEAFLNKGGLREFLQYVSDVSLIRTMLDTVEKWLRKTVFNGYAYIPSLFSCYPADALSENRFLSEEQINELLDYYPFLSDDDEPRIFDSRYTGNLCTVCRVPLEEKRMNVAVNDSDGSFYGAFVQYVHVCPRCNRIYVTLSDRERIRNEVKKIKSRLIVRYEPEEGSTSYRLYDRGYLDLPVVDLGICVDIDQNYNEHCYDDEHDDENENEDEEEEYGYLYSVNGLSEESFLKKMGYSTEVNAKRRREILDAAIAKYGKRRIIDRLQFFINMRKNQSRDYTYAINVWRNDIVYVIKH